MESELNLRQYIDVLIKHRWLIVATTAIAAVAALVVGLVREPAYEVAAGILIARTRTQVTFDPRFQTLESSDLRQAARLDESARRWALAALVESGYIANQVADQLAGELDPGERNPARLLEMVSGSVKEAGGGVGSQTANNDFIEIKVRSSEPAKATLIANTWAHVYESYVNDLYSKSSESLTSIREQVAAAEATYEEAEQALIDFIAESQIDELQRQTEEGQQLVTDLQAGRQSAFAESVKAEQTALSQHYATSKNLKRLLDDAKSLRLQIQQSEAPAAGTNELALMLLKAEAFASSGGLPGNLELQLDLGGSANPGASDQVADLEALIAVLEIRVAELDAAIAEQSQKLLAGGGYGSLEATSDFDKAIAELQGEVRRSRVQLAQERAIEKELVRARDLAWDTYSTLQVKAAELGIATEIADVEVRFASPAVEPIKPVDANRPTNVVVAGIVGLIVGIGATFALHYLSPEGESAVAVGGPPKRYAKADD